MYVIILPGSPSSVVSSASGFVTTIEVSGVTKLYCKKIIEKKCTNCRHQHCFIIRIRGPWITHMSSDS